MDSVARRNAESLLPAQEEPVRGTEQFAHVLAAAQANAGWAFERIFHLFAPRVRSFLQARGSLEPDELTNDVFMAVFRAVARFEGDESAFRAWLFTIAHHRLIDERRQHARRGSVVPSDLTEYHDESGGDVESEAMAILDRDWVGDLLSQLVPAQRDVLLLRVVADLTVDQIAHVVGKSPGAVKALQRRGLGALRRLLEQQGVPLQRSTDVFQD
ncbi:RNA polymerase sigma factor [Phytoactinopolyspora halotolerans]|uniref:RNA polymerase sigma factor n=1 Tax=Phytoactinopolyspora halotolerans TaxID=1981512 RepID=A0A6L9SGY2_9ACTN|nr:RNA polymerase sigma factor [Phytoactinopolyspora halotolerans]NEE04407.1 RNA polymerase sigma factor [Phytoactinopolyspora halotolerans]